MIGNLGNFRVVDLTQKIVPGQMGKRCEIRVEHAPRTDDYYCDMDIVSHLGTHLESPRHWNLDWKDVSEFPATAFMGRCVLLRVTDIEPAAAITAGHLENASKGRVQEDDIVIVDTPYHLPPFSFPEKEVRPFVNPDMAHWLIEKGIKCVGMGDGVDIETNVPEFKKFHEIAMAQDVTFIEVLENLDQLEREIFFFIALPLPFEGLDSCPVRAVAIEGIPGFDE